RQYIENYDYQLKFVVERREDFGEISALLDQLTGVDPERVLIMPQGIKDLELRRKAPWIVELCQRYHYRFTPRLHIELFGNRRGT
ncbi:MAG: radical SAM protein, partial [Candidatus Binatia bacterium]